MWKIAVCPTAFRGSLTARQAAEAIANGLRASTLPCDPLLMPLADGGNDTLEVWVQARQGQRRQVEVRDPLGRPRQAEFGVQGDTAVVEMARASGVELLKPSERNPLLTTTFGTGQLIRAAIQNGARTILVGVGGSATVDGGAGCLQALGARLLDVQGQPIPPGGGALGRLAQIDPTPARELLRGVTIQVLCDVDNPLLGPVGAAPMFGPQKGALPESVRQLEANLTYYAAIVRRDLGIEIGDVPRTGAAGGLSAGLYALGAELVSGAETLIQSCGYDAILAAGNVSLVITGEGKLDAQTQHGKAALGIAREARKHGIPVIALTGALLASPEELREWGFAAAWSIIPRPCALDEALQQGEQWLTQAATHLGDMLAAGGSF